MEAKFSSIAPTTIHGSASNTGSKVHNPRNINEMTTNIKINNGQSIIYTSGNVIPLPDHDAKKQDFLDLPTTTHIKRHRHRRSAAISHDFNLEDIPGIRNIDSTLKPDTNNSENHVKSIWRKSIIEINSDYQVKDNNYPGKSSGKEQVPKNLVPRAKVSFASSIDVITNQDSSSDEADSDSRFPRKRSSSWSISLESQHSDSSSKTDSIISDSSSMTEQPVNIFKSNNSRCKPLPDRKPAMSLSTRQKKVRSWAGSFFSSPAKTQPSNNDINHERRGSLSLDSSRSASPNLPSNMIPVFPDTLLSLSTSSLPLTFYNDSEESSFESPIQSEHLDNNNSDENLKVFYELEREPIIDLDAALSPFSHHKSKTVFRKQAFNKYGSNSLHRRSESLPNILDKFDELSEDAELQIDETSLNNRKRKMGLMVHKEEDKENFEDTSGQITQTRSSESKISTFLPLSSQDFLTSSGLQSKSLKLANRYSRYVNNPMSLAVAEARKNQTSENGNFQDTYQISVEPKETYRITDISQIEDQKNEYYEEYLENIGQPGPVIHGSIDETNYSTVFNQPLDVVQPINSDRLDTKNNLESKNVFVGSLDTKSPLSSPAANAPNSDITLIASNSDTKRKPELVAPRKNKDVHYEGVPQKVVKQKKSIGYRIRDWVKAKIT